MNKRRIFLIISLSILLMGCWNTYSAQGDINLQDNKKLGQSATLKIGDEKYGN